MAILNYMEQTRLQRKVRKKGSLDFRTSNSLTSRQKFAKFFNFSSLPLVGKCARSANDRTCEKETEQFGRGKKQNKIIIIIIK